MTTTLCPTLTTERLVLRTPQESDAPAIVEYCKLKEVAEKLCTVPHPYTLDDAHEWVAKVQANMGKGTACTWVICEAGDPALAIGAIGFGINRCFNSAELGYNLLKQHWGKGYASEALAETIRFAFEEEGMHKVWAGYFPDNPASGRVMRKCGMVEEGRQKDQVYRFGSYRDLILMGLTLNGWRALASE